MLVFVKLRISPELRQKLGVVLHLPRLIIPKQMLEITGVDEVDIDFSRLGQGKTKIFDLPVFIVEKLVIEVSLIQVQVVYEWGFGRSNSHNLVAKGVILNACLEVCIRGINHAIRKIPGHLNVEQRVAEKRLEVVEQLNVLKLSPFNVIVLVVEALRLVFLQPDQQADERAFLRIAHVKELSCIATVVSAKAHDFAFMLPAK